MKLPTDVKGLDPSGALLRNVRFSDNASSLFVSVSMYHTPDVSCSCFMFHVLCLCFMFYVS
jgi:hypothetical protein